MARKQRRTRRRTRGAGYGMDLSRSVGVGLPVVARYSGAGTDCAQLPTSVSSKSFGLPGFSGGSRRTRRTRGAGYGFPKSVDMLMSNPFQPNGCRGAPMMGGGSSSLSYGPATAGYSTAPMSVPGSAGFLQTIAHPDRVPSASCGGMSGGSRRRRHRKNKSRSRRA